MRATLHVATLIATFALLGSATAQSLVTEDFETGALPGGWTHHQGGYYPGNSCLEFHDPGEGTGLFMSLEACSGSYWSQNTGIETSAYDASACPSVTVEFGLFNAWDEADYCASGWSDTDPPYGECFGVSTDGSNYERLAHLTQNDYSAGTRHEISLDATDYTGGAISFYFAESDNYPYDYDGLLFDDFEVICGETLCEDGIDNDGDGDADCDDDDCTDGDMDGDGYAPCDGDCDDFDGTLNPGEAEICDGIDNDCDGLVDCNDPDAIDADGDGSCECDDCDDGDGDTYPGAPELCDGIDNDCDGDVPDDEIDDDGDGYDECGDGDCDDTNPDTYPAAPEICDREDNNCNGVIPPEEQDNDGDGATDCEGDCDDTDAALNILDADGDGQNTCAGDCNDGDAGVYDGAPEDLDGVDDDCDEYVDEDFVAEGDVIVSEIMHSPAAVADSDGEWFELYNNSSMDIDLWGWAVYDYGSDDFTIDEHIVFSPGEAVVLCSNGDFGANGGVACDYEYSYYSGMALASASDDEIVVELLGLVIDEVVYDIDGDFPADEGATISLEPMYYDDADNDHGINWCLADPSWVYGNGDLGTPGVFNPPCCWDDDGDGVTTCGPDGIIGNADDDCDDMDPNTFPGAEELCDQIDNDCDGVDDDGVVYVDWFDDADGDGYGDEGATPVNDCNDLAGSGYVQNDEDCDDTDASINPDASEICDGVDNDCTGLADDGLDFDDYYPDDDGDGFGDENGLIINDCEQPPGYVLDATDCDDTDADVSPDGTEVCNGVDDDCNGQIDDGLVYEDYFADDDGDGFGEQGGNPLSACSQPQGYVLDATDCDDTNAAIHPGALEIACDYADNDCDGFFHLLEVDGDGDGYDECEGDCDDYDADVSPGAAEVCNGEDDDCDGAADDGLIFLDYFPDADGDGFGQDGGAAINACEQPQGHVADDSDCDDADAAINPAAVEVCDAIDNDCDGAADDGLTFLDYYPDDDGDGYGDMAGIAINDCAQPGGYVADNTDCDDTNPSINPAAAEICDDEDNNCDGQVDEGLTFIDYYEDADGDGYGDANGTPVSACSEVEGYVDDASDCDDADAAINPDASEVCDAIDNDCDGQVDEDITFFDYYPDVDGDGYGDMGAAPINDCVAPADHVDNGEDCDDADERINPDANELACDGVDNDCDGDQHEQDVDDDGDGINECEGDCDDDDAAMNLDDADGDGWGTCDGDCDDADAELNLDDVDGDGYDTCDDDCDDDNAAANPGESEVHDAVDNDCDGLVDEGALPTGALLITEVMQNPDGVDDSDGEFFEVLNTTDLEINLLGLEVTDAGTDAFTVSLDVWVAAGEYAVLARNGDFNLNGGVDVHYVYPGDFSLANGDDELYLTHGEVELDAIEYDGGYDWPDPTGASMSLDPLYHDSVANDAGENWCETPVDAFYELESGDYASPANPNPDCCVDLDADGYLDLACGGDDCDDADPTVHPGAPEVCDGIDNNCNGVVPAEEADDDADGFMVCDDDCDDADADTYPGAVELCDGIDNDCDGVLPADELDGDGDGFTGCQGDCDDTDADTYAGAAELCDGVDNDCDGAVDNDLTFVDYYADADEDGYGNAAGLPLSACEVPDGYVEDNTDCDDADATVNPGMGELCDGLDNDCDGTVDEDLVYADYYLDADGDGYGDPLGPTLSDCVAPEGYADNTDDCDDANADVNPGATEEPCDGIDNDCDGFQHDEDVDDDGDGYSECDGDCDDLDATLNLDDLDLDGFSTCDGDCDDGDDTLNPGEDEICDGIDNDCNADTDETLDEDGDGYSECDGDCDDLDAEVNPDALEICDGIDNDCDAATDEEVDDDADGFTECDGDCDDDDANTFPEATELCDGIDNDCDGVVPEDEADADGDGQMVCDGDCDDDDATTYTGAPEQCDGIDNDCDGVVDEDVDTDDDGDGLTECEGDCDDSDAATFPGAAELCDGMDNDCDGAPAADELDVDGDGWFECNGDCDDTDAALNLDDVDQDGLTTCDGDCDDLDAWYNLDDDDADGFTTCDGDCDDADGTSYTGAPELCDGIDNDCDGVLPEDETIDADADGYLACEDCDDADPDVWSPDADEDCFDGVDNDCDGLVDEEDDECDTGDDDDDDSAGDDDDTVGDDDDDDSDDPIVPIDDDDDVSSGGCDCQYATSGHRVGAAAVFALLLGAVFTVRRRR